MWADFVASAEITQGYVESEDNLNFNMGEYWIKIKPTEVYKGKVADSLKVTGTGMCMLGLKTDTKWIIYAVENQEGILEISYCSGSEQVDKYEHHSVPVSENVKSNHSLSIEKEIHLLEILEKKKIRYTHPHFSIISDDFWEKLEAYQGIISKDEFAIFEIEFTNNLRIKDVEVISGFNSKLDKELRELISKSNFVENGRVHVQKTDFRWLIGIYYYPEEEGNPSFLSRWIL